MKIYVSVILGIFLASLLIPQHALALDGSDVSLTPDFISSCPARTLSVDDISLFVTNSGPTTDTFFLSIDWLPGLSFIEPMVTLASGERTKIEPLWITIPYEVEPGSLFAAFDVRSGITHETVSRTLEINILNCHVVELDVSPNERTQEVCSETPSTAEYTLGVTNLGMDTETFELTASVPWVVFDAPTVTLQPQESETVVMTADPPDSLTGMQTITMTAVSTTSYAEDSTDVFLEIADCFDFDVSLQPSQATSCLGEEAEFTLLISNTGMEDTFTIIAPEPVILSTDEIMVGENNAEQITASLAPPGLGDTSFEITIQSQADVANRKTVTGTITGNDCRGVSVIIAPAEVSVCQGDVVEFEVSITNTGSLAATFDVEATRGVVEQTGVNVGPDETIIVPLTVDTAALMGTETVTVTASDGTVSDTGTVTVNSRVCYKGVLTIEPLTATACPFTGAQFMITLANTGEFEDTFTLKFGNTTTTVTLAPGEEKPFELTFPVSVTESTALLVNATATSDNGVKLEATATLTIKDMETCYAVSLINGEEERVRINAATAVPLILRNEGEQPGVFSLSVDGPEYIYIEPRTVSLGFNEERTVYMYLSPHIGTEPVDFTATVSVFSQHAQTTLDVPVSVLSTDGITQPTAPTEPGNVTINDTEGRVSLNITVEDGEAANGQPLVIGNITGGLPAIDLSPIQRTAVVAVITIIIIIILIARFAFLFKS